jgi:hypothetical protein
MTKNKRAVKPPKQLKPLLRKRVPQRELRCYIPGCRNRVKHQNDLCATHVQAQEREKARKLPKYIATPAQWVNVRSETRPEIVHHVWTGEPVEKLGFWLTPPHCTCENFRWGDRHPGMLFMCKHIDAVIFGNPERR